MRHIFEDFLTWPTLMKFKPFWVFGTQVAYHQRDRFLPVVLAPAAR